MKNACHLMQLYREIGSFLNRRLKLQISTFLGYHCSCVKNFDLSVRNYRNGSFFSCEENNKITHFLYFLKAECTVE